MQKPGMASELRMLFVLSALFCAVAACARVEASPATFESTLHRYDDYRIQVIRSKGAAQSVDALVAHPKKVRIVVWQAPPQDTRAEDTRRVMEWVHEGGVVWFQDSRLAENFGMQSDPIGAAEVRDGRKQKRDYAGAKVEGMSVIVKASPGVPHPVLTGVNAAQVFVLQVGGDAYSAIRQTDGVVPLLAVDPTADPPSPKLIAGLRTEGKGTVVFKPLVWTDHLDGLRLQGNLLEWSAGFPIRGD